VAQWKLGRMYADGEGVPRDDLRAFNYFSQIAAAPDTKCCSKARSCRGKQRAG
jgi:TPR repeat protein